MANKEDILNKLEQIDDDAKLEIIDLFLAKVAITNDDRILKRWATQFAPVDGPKKESEEEEKPVEPVKKVISQDDYLRTAKHEIGHLFMSDYYKMHVLKVTVKPTKRMLGHVKRRKDKFPERTNFEKNIAELNINIAGYVAHRILDPSYVASIHSDIATKDDYSKALKFAKSLSGKQMFKTYTPEEVIKNQIDEVSQIMEEQKERLMLLSQMLADFKEFSSNTEVDWIMNKINFI